MIRREEFQTERAELEASLTCEDRSYTKGTNKEPTAKNHPETNDSKSSR